MAGTDTALETAIQGGTHNFEGALACGQGGSASVCHYERAQLQVAMESWQGVPLGREEQDTVLAEYIHTAGQYGQNQQQRMERIGAEALSGMVVDSISAPVILGSLVGQALLGDEESRATLQSVGAEIKALAADPANYISESNREQLARADALEQAGRLDDADKLRVRVALDNESMLMGVGGLAARLPRLARNVVTRSGMAEIGFADNAKLISHFEKHGAEFGAKSSEEYLQVGKDIMQKGYKVKYEYKGENRTGYVQFMGNSSRRGNANFGFVGTNSNGAITTIHVESKSFWKMLNGDAGDKTIRPVP